MCNINVILKKILLPNNKVQRRFVWIVLKGETHGYLLQFKKVALSIENKINVFYIVYFVYSSTLANCIQCYIKSEENIEGNEMKSLNYKLFRLYYIFALKILSDDNNNKNISKVGEYIKAFLNNR